MTIKAIALSKSRKDISEAALTIIDGELPEERRKRLNKERKIRYLEKIELLKEYDPQKYRAIKDSDNLKHLKRCEKYREKNKDKIKFKAKTVHVEKSAEYKRKYYDKNRDHILEKNKIFKENNKEKVLVWNIARKSRLKNTIPKWVDYKKIRTIYRERLDIEKKTGDKYHVDHIIPINSKYVCGLTIPENLRTITEFENLSKSNNFVPFSIDSDGRFFHLSKESILEIDKRLAEFEATL